jgi:hypothetical protein
MNKSSMMRGKVLIVFALVLASSTLLLGALAYNIALSQAPGVELGPDHTQYGKAGQNIVYHHVLTNTGTETDTFLLEALSTQGWAVRLLSGSYPSGAASLPLQVGAQMTTSFQVSLTIPPDAAGVTEVTVITATAQLSPTVQDTVVDTTIVYHRILLPLLVKRWPPIPYPSILNPIDNTDGDGFYTVNWPPTELAQTYSLEEDEDVAFSSPTIVYSGAGTFWSVPSPGKTAGTYYYRVRGHNTWGYGEYSNIEAVTVLLPDTPVLNTIDNTDGDGNYDVTWGAAARATSYTLQEDTVLDFSSPTTVYAGAQTLWSATGKTPGTYYYRVLANGPTGQSGWSSVRAAAVLRFRADDTSLTAGQCTTLRWNFSGIKELYISFGYGYDKEGVPGQGSRQVCPSVTTTYEALVIRQDGGHETHRVTIDVSGSGCGDPVIQRFAPSTYHVPAGQPFSIFWDVECAKTVHFIGADGSEEPVVGHGSKTDVTIYTSSVFRLKVEKSNDGFVYASFTVYVVSGAR